ncbi:MAG: CoA-binding protein [Syntrophus sp. (in: bacteria)]|nr:CoA-binding protein [Syntrophus sp. (in: bacteria)]
MVGQDDIIIEILKSSRTIAIVGLSPVEGKPSNGVAIYLQKAGYRIIPVNPGHEEILGEKSYKSLSAIPEKVDIVDIFMRSEKVVPVVEEAVTIKPRCIWLQLGIKSEEGKAVAEKHNIAFIMDKCIKQEYERLMKSSGGCQEKP